LLLPRPQLPPWQAAQSSPARLVLPIWKLPARWQGLLWQRLRQGLLWQRLRQGLLRQRLRQGLLWQRLR
jgi:hypothetical protein